MSNKKQKSKAAPADPEQAADASDASESPPPDEAGQDGVEDAAEAGPEAQAVADDEAADPSGWAAGALEALRQENAELKDRLLRAAAEMDNLRKRTERDKTDTAKYAISNFARDVLTVADNIQRAIDHVPEDAAEQDPALKSFRDGIDVTERELLKVMERHGITRLDPKGERFDPNCHQAMFEVPNAEVPSGTVLEVVQAGYVIADRVLRPAMVGVAKGGPKAAKEPADAAADETADGQAPEAANDDEPGQDVPPKTQADEKGLGGNFDTTA